MRLLENFDHNTPYIITGTPDASINCLAATSSYGSQLQSIVLAVACG